MDKKHLQGNIAPDSRHSVLIVLPVFNEESILCKSVTTLSDFLRDKDEYSWKIMIADNSSKDGTGDIGRMLAAENPLVEYLNIPKKGVGIAVKTAWAQADSDFVNYMDVDLSTSLEALIPSLDLLKKGADIVVANRLAKDSKIERCLKREIVSRSYNMIIKLALQTNFHDAHCGFKTARRDVAQSLLPYIEDEGFFFAAEFMFYGEKLGHKIVEIPVAWDEDPDTKANILKDAYADFKGLYRLRVHNNLKMKKE